ncbi:hypothetical protein OIO90_002032 [Microbotryomycetes sp. JL221]|nr:hypothetical protein OIO90_002032 [Microbotryomycetes sp. JL221]
MVVKPNRTGGDLYPTGYTDLHDHALVGNMRTAALISISGTVAQLCLPHFDSPSVFARILDKDHGGHFSLRPTTPTTSKQQYLPSTNIVATKFLSEDGVGQIDDFMPLPADRNSKQFLPWLVRHVTVIRGQLSFTMECAPAFNYARSKHDTQVSDNLTQAHFSCPDHLDLDLRVVTANGHKDTKPDVKFELLDLSERGHKGLGVTSTFTLVEGQTVTFILREPPKPTTSGYVKESHAAPDHSGDRGENRATADEDPHLTSELIEKLFAETTSYWIKWVSQCSYTGRWREAVVRSALCLKLLTFAPTGAIVAAPTFSLPEDLHGAGRNWDYRYSWLRDSAFSVYALLRLGFTDEADQYVEWLSSLLSNRNEDGALQIMYTIHGGKDIPELELPHLDGHKGQKPVRIGNGAADHLQLDIYGELMDAIYLAQKLSKPLGYDTWLQVRSIVDFVCEKWDQPDLSIWEVRGEKQNFLYSKGRNRSRFEVGRQTIFAMPEQNEVHNDVLDSAVLIMPLCFFTSANDPRFLSTIKQIMLSRERGGLTENNLVYRYDTDKVDDGTGGGEEGAFTMVTLWLIEALSRAGEYDKNMLAQSVSMLEDFIGYSNHVNLLSEEISKGGEPLGNFPQAFSHVSLISTCFNVDRAIKRWRG